MYFTQARRLEYVSGVQMCGLQEIEKVLAAVHDVASLHIESGMQTVVATLATGRTWTARLSGESVNCAYICPCPDQSFAVGFSGDQKRLDTGLARVLNRELGTTTIALICSLEVSEQGRFSLDATWLYRVLKYFGFQNEYTPDGDTLACHLANNRHPETLRFSNIACGVQLAIDDSRLGPLVDSELRPQRNCGYGAVQGVAYADACEITLTLTDTTGFAFGERQRYLRAQAQHLLAHIAPPG